MISRAKLPKKPIFTGGYNMLSYYIKVKISFTDVTTAERKTTFASGIYPTPYAKGGKLNDCYLIGKVLKTFVCNEENREKDLFIWNIEILDTHCLGVQYYG